MDPDTALANARAAHGDILAILDGGGLHLDDLPAAADKLADAFAALDGWLTRGGFLPKAWAR